MFTTKCIYISKNGLPCKNTKITFTTNNDKTEGYCKYHLKFKSIQKKLKKDGWDGINHHYNMKELPALEYKPTVEKSIKETVKITEIEEEPVIEKVIENEKVTVNPVTDTRIDDIYAKVMSRYDEPTEVVDDNSPIEAPCDEQEAFPRKPRTSATKKILVHGYFTSLSVLEHYMPHINGLSQEARTDPDLSEVLDEIAQDYVEEYNLDEEMSNEMKLLFITTNLATKCFMINKERGFPEVEKKRIEKAKRKLKKIREEQKSKPNIVEV